MINLDLGKETIRPGDGKEDEMDAVLSGTKTMTLMAVRITLLSFCSE